MSTRKHTSVRGHTRSQARAHDTSDASDVSDATDAAATLERHEPGLAALSPNERARVEALARRALRMRREGAFRQAANAYGELTSVAPAVPRFWVHLGLTCASHHRAPDAVRALRQAAYLLHRAGETLRERTVRALLARVEAGAFSLDAPRARGLARRRAAA